MAFAFPKIWQPWYQDRAWRELRERKIEETASSCEDCGSYFSFLSRWRLQLSHNDHDPRNRAAKNLVLRCIPCHSKHDAPHVLAMRRRRQAQKDGQMALFSEWWTCHLPGWVPDDVYSPGPGKANLDVPNEQRGDSP